MRIARACCGRLWSSSQSAAPRAGSSWRSACAARERGAAPAHVLDARARPPAGWSRNQSTMRSRHIEIGIALASPATACWMRGFAARRRRERGGDDPLRHRRRTERRRAACSGSPASTRSFPAPIIATNAANAAALSIQPGTGCVRHAETMLGRTIVTGRSPARRTVRCSARHLVSVYVFGWPVSASRRRSSSAARAERRVERLGIARQRREHLLHAVDAPAVGIGMGRDVGGGDAHVRLEARARARDLERVERALRVDGERLRERQRELDRRRAVDHVGDLGGDARARERLESECGTRDVAGQRLDALLPAVRKSGETRRGVDVRAAARCGVLRIARAHEREHALDPELLAAAQQLLEHDLAHEAGRAREQDRARQRSTIRARRCSTSAGSTPISRA